MGGLLTSINAAKTSLEVNQKSIEVVGNNISNVATEGYSRQNPDLATYPAMNFGNFFIGNGVTISDISREHDVFLEKQIKEKSVDFGFQEGQTMPLAQLEQIFNVTEDNLSTDIDKFFDSLQELSASPSDMVQRGNVLLQAEALASNFNNTVDQLNTIKININDTLVSELDTINAQITEIGELNERIIAIESQGQTANGARDQRDRLAKDLAKTIGAQSFEDGRGALNVILPGGQPLVQGVISNSITGDASGANLTLYLQSGGVTRELTSSHLGGEFQGLMQIRDNLIPELTADLDQIAYELSVQVNLQHQAGGTLNSEPGGLLFNMPPNYVASPPGPPPTAAEYSGAARSLTVLIKNGEDIAAGLHPDQGTPPGTVAEGDNRNALLLSDIGGSYKVDGVDGFNSLYSQIAAKIGYESNLNQMGLQGAEDALVQLENFRDGVSGVSLETEMISLIQYQRGFESSAKFLSIIDEMMGTLLAIKQ